jgi:hypothetical protein
MQHIGLLSPDEKVKDVTKGFELEMIYRLSERQKEIVLAGGMLNLREPHGQARGLLRRRMKGKRESGSMFYRTAIQTLDFSPAKAGLDNRLFLIGNEALQGSQTFIFV